MKRIYQVSTLVFFVFAGVIALESSRLRYYSVLGPGPGFFPLWLTGIMAMLTLLWLLQVSYEPDAPVPADFWPDRSGALRVIAVALSILFMVFTMDLLGFRLAMFAMLAFLLYALGRQKLAITAVISLLGSFGFYYALTTWLGGSLPKATLEILANLGL